MLSAPRIRGDDPPGVYDAYCREASAPRIRGDDPRKLDDHGQRLTVLPAYAGMIPCARSSWARAFGCSPHTRG